MSNKRECDTVWIPITDKLPEKKRFVLVACVSPEGNHVRVPVTAHHYGDGVFETINWYSSHSTTGVTHWMPLPKQV